MCVGAATASYLEIGSRGDGLATEDYSGVSSMETKIYNKQNFVCLSAFKFGNLFFNGKKNYE